MPLKKEIIGELGSPELLVTDRIVRALAANDEVKYYLALLQTARSNADHPRIPVPDLKAERIACQIRDEALDEVVAGTTRDGDGNYRVPRIAELLRRSRIAVETMLGGLPGADKEALQLRLERLEWPPVTKEAISGAKIDALTSGDRAKGDSLHLIVMDAHRAINKLQSATAPENILGASVHGASSAARSLIAAFMEGLNRTAPLKFDHPGLGTTATETGGRLLIQNDIGTTDAHVLVIRVEGLVATVTYTDVHLKRLEFFQSLFESFGVVWDNTGSVSSERINLGSYFLSSSTYKAQSSSDLARYLNYLGSRIVFLIDWNHARKRLRAFVSKSKSVDVLKWAADHNFGHRALLEIGGERALGAAVEYAAGQRLHYGDRLDELISESNATAFLREALQVSATGLLAGRSRRMIQDDIKARMKRYFEEAGLSVFEIVARHAACGFDLACGVREALDRARSGDDNADWVAKFKVRASGWEARADQLLNDAREDVKRFKHPSSLGLFLGHADDAVDELEEAASLIDVFCAAERDHVSITTLLISLSDTVVDAAQEMVKSIECAATITRADMRDDLDDFLAALERLVALEHRADEVTRVLRRHFVTEVKDAGMLYVINQLSDSLETATDAYLHAGRALRDYLMEEVIR